MFKSTLIAAAVAVFSLTYSTNYSHAEGTALSCGYWAFAGAFQNSNSAYRKQRRVGGAVWNLAGSDSPNAHLDLYVIAQGPSTRGQANIWKRQFRARGVHDAYVARRCLLAG